MLCGNDEEHRYDLESINSGSRHGHHAVRAPFQLLCAQTTPRWNQKSASGAAAVEDKVIKWRDDIHEHPELADQEVRTSHLVADHLRSLGLEVRTGVARNGVIGVLKVASPVSPWRLRGHGCAAGQRAGRAAVRVEGQAAVSTVRKSMSCTPAGTMPTRRCSWELLRCWRE